jgi:hypothetical protein
VRQGTYAAPDHARVSWDEVVLGIEGPEARARRRTADAAGKQVVFERVEDGRFLRYGFERSGGTLRAKPGVAAPPGDAFGVSASPAAAAAAPPPLVLMDLPPAAEPRTSGERGESASIGVRLRGTDGRERVASFPRSLLQRLIRGREVDLTPERPLQALTPAAAVLGTSRTLMVLAQPDETRPPWSGLTAERPGEEDAARLAFALTRWWSSDPSSPGVAVCGVDPIASPPRWERAPRLDGKLAVVAPESAFPAQAAAFRAGLEGLPGGAGASVVVIVSAESPGLLGRRLRALATDPAYAGRIVAVASFGGPLRGDLPASILGDGRLAALGLYEAGPVGLTKSIAEIARFARSAASDASKGRRIEDLPGPFTWYY